MTYLEKHVLNKDEKIQIAPQKNPIFLVIAWIWGVLGCWLFFIPTYKAIKATINFKTTEYLVTDKKVMEKHGWISTRTNEMPLSKIENLVVNYTFWGKLFNYGTVICKGTNYDNIVFHHVMDAESLKKQLNSLI